MKHQPSGVYFYVPSLFRPWDCPALVGLENESNWFVHKIISLHNSYHHDGGGFVCVSYETIATFIHPRHVTTVKRALLDAGVIETDDYYLPSVFDPTGAGKSLGYRITATFIAGGLRRVECTKPSLAAKIQRRRVVIEDKPVEPEHLDAIHTYLLNQLRRLRIDSEKASKIIDGLPVGPTGSAHLRAAMCQMTCDRIAGGDFDMQVCRYGRVHTPITRLVTPARSALLVENEPLVNLDIRNSQLVFLALASFTNSCRKTTRFGMTRGVGWLGVGCASLSYGGAKRRNRKFCKTSESDSARFVTLVMRGELYDVLMDRVGIADRTGFKRLFFRDVLYGEDGRHYSLNSPIRKVFADLFPSVHDFIVAQKRRDYRELARQMQRDESAFVIGTVCERLRLLSPDLPAITIHDSILTTRPHVATVLDTMNEEFHRLGISPTIAVSGSGGVE